MRTSKELSVILGIIVACEIGFWIAVIGGLAARYLLGRRRLGAWLLVAAPIVDVVLVAAVGIDMHSGGSATFFHGLAAIYIGISLVYGRSMVRWADVRFAHRFADGPPPERVFGAAYARVCWRAAVRTACAMGIAALILVALITWVGDPERTAALSSVFGTLAVVVAIDVIWAASYTFWPRSEPKSRVEVPGR